MRSGESVLFDIRHCLHLRIPPPPYMQTRSILDFPTQTHSKNASISTYRIPIPPPSILILPLPLQQFIQIPLRLLHLANRIVFQPITTQIYGYLPTLPPSITSPQTPSPLPCFWRRGITVGMLPVVMIPIDRIRIKRAISRTRRDALLFAIDRDDRP